MKKTKKLSYGTVSAMCFVFILTENKWYIFFKKEIKRHTEKVCGTVKGANVQAKTLKGTDSLTKSNKQWELWSLNFHNHLLSP